jgi:hypothetical protein
LFLEYYKAGGINIRNVSKLNLTLGKALMQQLSPDPRNLAIFLTAVVSVLASQNVALSAWISWLSWKIKAASSSRRFIRWLDNPSILPYAWYKVIFQHAIQNWTPRPIFIILDTSMLYDSFCCVRISMLYLNRAIPVTWCVLKHNSASVKYERYSYLLEQAEKILPRNMDIVFLADRGFVSKKLMLHLQKLKWTWRIRVKSNQKLLSRGHYFMPKSLPLTLGKALLFSGNINFGRGLEHLSLSAGRAKGSQETWYVLSGDKVASVEAFIDYSKRFGIEEGFKDEKSGGFGLEKSRIREEEKLERLILLIATALIVSISAGVSVVLEEKREEIDSHWRQGLSYFQIGIRWFVKCLMNETQEFFWHCLLRAMNEPLPIAPTRKVSILRRKMKNPSFLFEHTLQCDTFP